MHKKNYDIEAIGKITGGRFAKPIFHNDIITTLLIDSRKLISPGQSLFFALKTGKNDGHNYIQDLFNKGVRNFVVSDFNEHFGSLPANFILVDDTLKALQALASYHRHQYDYTVAAITGSNGKTIVKEWLAQLMDGWKKLVRSPKSFNSQVGVPLSIWNMSSKNDFAIFEAGISQTGEMEKLEQMIRPGTGIFINIGQAHSQGFRSLEEKVLEKLKLFHRANSIVYCKDHAAIHHQIKNLAQTRNIKTFSWSLKNENCELFITSIDKKTSETLVKGLFDGHTQNIQIPFTDDASIENAIHCWAFLLYHGLCHKDIESRFATLSPVAMRLELKQGVNNCSIINDAYNTDINSLSLALDFLAQQQQHSKKTVILSDIMQSGIEKSLLYKSVSEFLKARNVNKLIGIGADIYSQQEQFTQKEATFYKTTNEFLDQYPYYRFQDETILLKGARIFRFEKISNRLQQKAHQTVLEIDLGALLHNLDYYRKKIQTSTKIMAMVKAFSYGTGSFEIANILQYHNIDYLAVAYADEGMELRKSGISTPIMVMNPEEDSFDQLLDENLEPEIYSFKVLKRFAESARKNGITAQQPAGVHIKFDTGMHRLGFLNVDTKKLIDFFKTNPNLRIKSVFSHLAASDEPQHDDFTKKQAREFDEIATKIQSQFNYKILKHIANSAAITRFPGTQYDMVRLGISLYGIATNRKDQTHLRNVCNLKTSISQIKSVKKGETIGYSRKGVAKEDMKIAIIAIGYADGLNRLLSNGNGYVYIKGEKLPIIGNICMDMAMVDITGIDAKEDDEVVIFDKSKDIIEMAEKLKTIPYEILTGISRRVKRIYFQE